MYKTPVQTLPLTVPLAYPVTVLNVSLSIVLIDVPVVTLLLYGLGCYSVFEPVPSTAMP